MAKPRKPKTLVLYAELEDNVGAILAKSRVEIPVIIETDLTEAQIRQVFEQVAAALPPSLKV